MERVTLRAYGKINIGLDITGKREDGYHLLKTVMQTVNIYDEISVSERPKGIMLTLDQPFLPGDERNLAFKAARLVSERYPQSAGVRIEIKKKIPVGGGMAGGSTDAAGVIHAMDRLFGLRMSWQEKDEIAVRIGADVPFCLRKGVWLAEGIGERLRHLPDLPDLSVLICAPGFPVSTAGAYEAYDNTEPQYHPDMDRLVAAIREKNPAELFLSMGNSLEPVVEKKHAQITKLKKLLQAHGASTAMMSGSGSTVFGLFEDEKKARAAGEIIKTEASGVELYITGFIKGDKNDGIETEL